MTGLFPQNAAEFPDPPETGARVISYEYPLNERIRTLLRLEDLFERSRHFIARTDPLDHHVALLTVFEILEVAGRADLKSDLLQELERQKQVLLTFRDSPDISEDALTNVLRDIEQASAALFSMTGRIGQYLRENEWLMSIKQRASIPGGTSEFDLPSYHRWLSHSPERRRGDLTEWLSTLLPVHAALSIVLRVLRESGRTTSLIAFQGMYQQTPAEKPAQMLRLTIADELPCVPEISANKYALNVRFLLPDSVNKTRVYDQDVPFELSFCNL